MTEHRWTGPAIGVMRPGFIAVSGCRPPTVKSAASLDIPCADLFDAILADVASTIGVYPEYRIVHGGAEGVDQAARAASRLRGEVYRPNYAHDGGRAAPAFRNWYATTTELFRAWPAPWSRGTWDAVKKRLTTCGAAGFELCLVGWGQGGEGLPADAQELLGKVGAKVTEVRL